MRTCSSSCAPNWVLSRYIEWLCDMQLTGLKVFWNDYAMVWNCYEEPKDMQCILDVPETMGKIYCNWLQA